MPTTRARSGSTIDNLGGKSYWAQRTCTPEFVVLFLPGEVLPGGHGFGCGVDRVRRQPESPRGLSQATLIALLKAVAYGWNQKNLAESARKISEAGKDLYKRNSTMTGHMHEMGQKLGGKVKSYDEMVRSMERRVFPIARKFPELDHSLPPQLLPEIEQLDGVPFELQAPD